MTVKLITVLATIAAPILIVVHEFLAGAGSMKVRVYTCKKHPKWSLETAAPVIAGSLQTVCPLCREEFIIKNIGLPDCRIEDREAATEGAKG